MCYHYIEMEIMDYNKIGKFNYLSYEYDLERDIKGLTDYKVIEELNEEKKLKLIVDEIIRINNEYKIELIEIDSKYSNYNEMIEENKALSSTKYCLASSKYPINIDILISSTPSKIFSLFNKNLKNSTTNNLSLNELETFKILFLLTILLFLKYKSAILSKAFSNSKLSGIVTKTLYISNKSSKYL